MIYSSQTFSFNVPLFIPHISARIRFRTIITYFNSSLLSYFYYFSQPFIKICFIHSSTALQHFVGPWPLLQFRNLFYTVGKTPGTGDQPVARPLPTHRTTQTQNKRTQTSMPWVGFEPMIPAFKWPKTVHASDRAATVTALKHDYSVKF
jgi:hypothetical protein